MTHTPSESKAWPRAGAADRPSSSGRQAERHEEPASDLPAAGRNAEREPMTPPFPEAGRHDGDRGAAAGKDPKPDSSAGNNTREQRGDTADRT